MTAKEALRLRAAPQRQRGLLLGLLLTLALGVACEYPGIPHRLAAQVPAASLPKAASAAKTTAQSAPAESQTTPVLQGKAPVTQKDFKLEPDNLTIKAGEIAFVLKNEGRFTHDFRVEGQGVDDRAPKVGSGRTLEWRITLQPGTYRISCPISNHADRGMVGILTVVP